MLLNSQAYFLAFTGLSLFALGSCEFHLLTMGKSYEDAKSYCREMYSDLATIHNITEKDDLINLVLGTVRTTWIGLEIANKRMWHWSLPGDVVNYTNWSEGNPQENDNDACGAMNESGKWFESDCQTKRSFVCHGAVGPHIYVAEKKSWRNAQNYCRNLSTDLVRILSAEENEAVKTISQNSWTGLFKDPWKWSDGSNSSFRFWGNSQPNYLEGQNCTAIIFKNNGKWNDLPCTGKRKFICQGAYKAPTTTTTPISTRVTNMSMVSNITSESAIVTYHFTLDRNGTNSTTAPSTNATSVSALTTVPVKTNSPSAFPNTTLTVTLAPKSNTQGNLILIKENFTWIEAIAYCRSHYIDLIHISTEDVQRKVAEKAKNATTPHVWIGLKYACSSKIWFWTKSSSGCYQNWAPQQGSERNYNCDVTGAIEATGRQQWVGLPQTQKLNFICSVCSG